MEIKIEKLKVYGYIGVYEEEKKNGQEFFISVNCKLKDSTSYNTDKLDNTVNYGAVCDIIIDYVENVKCDLIETVAEDLASMILQTYDVISEITVRIDKPNAPVDADFSNIYVSCTKTWEKVYISLGSNIGDKDFYLEEAINKLRGKEKIRNLRISSFNTTKPYGNTNQDDFRNAVLELETFYTPLELLDVCNEIEDEAGRVRKEHWGPRTLDLDILLFGDIIINDKNLNIPHIDMHNRLFVLEPLCEIAPNACHPVIGKSAYMMLKELQIKEL